MRALALFVMSSLFSEFPNFKRTLNVNVRLSVCLSVARLYLGIPFNLVARPCLVVLRVLKDVG